MPSKNKPQNIIFHNQTGFTLIELLISIVVLTVGILGLIKVVDSVIFYQDQSHDNSRAALFVTNKIEEIKRLSTNEPAGGIYGFDYLVREYANETGMTVIDDTTFSINKVFDQENGEPTITTIVLLCRLIQEGQVARCTNSTYDSLMYLLIVSISFFISFSYCSSSTDLLLPYFTG